MIAVSHLHSKQLSLFFDDLMPIAEFGHRSSIGRLREDLATSTVDGYGVPTYNANGIEFYYIGYIVIVLKFMVIEILQ